MPNEPAFRQSLGLKAKQAANFLQRPRPPVHVPKRLKGLAANGLAMRRLASEGSPATARQSLDSPAWGSFTDAMSDEIDRCPRHLNGHLGEWHVVPGKENVIAGIVDDDPLGAATWRFVMKYRIGAPEPHDVALVEHANAKIHLLALMDQLLAIPSKRQKQAFPNGMSGADICGTDIHFTRTRCELPHHRATFDIDKWNRDRTDAVVREVAKSFCDDARRAELSIIVNGEYNRRGRKPRAAIPLNDQALRSLATNEPNARELV